MMIIATCTCGRRFQTQDVNAGKRTRCPACGDMLVVPIPGPNGGSPGKTDKPTPPSWWYPQGQPEASRGPARPGAATGETRTRITPPPHAVPSPAVEVPPGPEKPGPEKKSRWLMVGSGVGGATLLLAGLLFWMSHSGPTREPVPGGGPAGGQPPPPDPDGKPKSDSDGPKSRPLVAGQPRLKLLVPAYFYPAGPGLKYWGQLIDAASHVPVVAVANPSSGPGEQRNPDYAAIVSRATRGRVTVVGYVGTNYAHRPLPEVKADVDRWVEFYPEIGGIFFDAQASEAGQSEYYVNLRDYVRGKIKGGVVINNPGTTCAEEYAARLNPVALCLFTAPSGFEEFRLPRWAEQHPAERFGAMPFGVAGPEQMRDFIQVAPSRGFGLIYVTDAQSPNLWDRLPSYWGAEVEAVRRVNSGQAP